MHLHAASATTRSQQGESAPRRSAGPTACSSSSATSSRATIGLEAYIEALRELPDAHAWLALRDLSDVAAALPYLDHDLSEAVLPLLKHGEDWALPYRMLTHPGHDALRVVAGEVRDRVPAAEPPTSAARSPARGPQPVHPSSSQVPGEAAATGPSSAGGDRRDLSDRAARGPQVVGDLAEAMRRYTHAVSARGANLSVADVKGVRRLLEHGSVGAATVLERAAPAVAGAAEAARARRATAACADRLREAPARSMTAPHLQLAAASKNLLDQTTALAGQGAQLTGRATPQELRRLAAAALGFAQCVPALAGALDLSVREALAARLILVPGTTSESSTNTISWVTTTMGPHRDGPPAIAAGTGELSMTARGVAPAVQQAAQDLDRHAAAPPTPTQLAAIAARRHVGAARCERLWPTARPASPACSPRRCCRTRDWPRHRAPPAPSDSPPAAASAVPGLWPVYVRARGARHWQRQGDVAVGALSHTVRMRYTMTASPKGLSGALPAVVAGRPSTTTMRGQRVAHQQCLEPPRPLPPQRPTTARLDPPGTSPGSRGSTGGRAPAGVGVTTRDWEALYAVVNRVVAVTPLERGCLISAADSEVTVQRS